MKLVLGYTKLDYDKSVSTPVICIDAESSEAVRDALENAAIVAEQHQKMHFEFCGEHLAPHNFLRPIPSSRWEQIVSLCTVRKTPVPRFVMIRGKVYTFRNFRVLPLEDWFKQEARALAATPLVAV